MAAAEGLASTMRPDWSTTSSESGYAANSERNTLPSSMPEGRPGMEGGVVSSVMGDRRHEDVACAAHRFDELRIVGVGLDLLAQPADLHIDRAIEGRSL